MTGSPGPERLTSEEKTRQSLRPLNYGDHLTRGPGRMEEIQVQVWNLLVLYYVA